MISLFVLSMLLVQGPGALQPGTGIVTGSVQVAGGGSPAGIRVAAIPIDDPTGSSFLSVAETDAAGRYRLSSIPAGRYYIVAGRVTSLTYYPGGTDRAKAMEVSVEPAKVTPNVNFMVPADSKRPDAGQLFNQFPATVVLSPAQVQEWNAYRQIAVETNVEKKLQLLLSFEKAYRQSKQLPTVYTSLMEIYLANHNEAKSGEYGTKALKQDPQNVTALVLMSRKHALLQNDAATAVQYAEKAVAAATRLKTQPAPASSDPQAWRTWVASLDSNARSNLTWVRSFQAAQEKALLSNVIRRR